MGAPPIAQSAPIAPSIQETGGTGGQSSTYEARDTLNSKQDEDLFDYYALSQLALVDANSAALRPMGKPGDYEALDPAPDGQHILVTRMSFPIVGDPNEPMTPIWNSSSPMPKPPLTKPSDWAWSAPFETPWTRDFS